MNEVKSGFFEVKQIMNDWISQEADFSQFEGTFPEPPNIPSIEERLEYQEKVSQYVSALLCANEQATDLDNEVMENLEPKFYMLTDQMTALSKRNLVWMKIVETIYEYYNKTKAYVSAALTALASSRIFDYMPI